MSLSYGPNIGLLINGAAGEEHYSALMQQWRGFDLLVQPVVKDKDLAAPPGSPVDGDAYIVAASPTGAWSSHATHIARWSSLSGIGWEFYTPREGWHAWVQDEDKRYVFNGTAWAEVSSGGSTTPSARTESASTTLVLADADNGGREIRMNASGANTITVPPNTDVAIPVNTSIPVLQQGAGATTVAQGAGVTVHTASPLTLALRARWSQAVLTKIGTDEWVLTGDLA